MLPKNLKLSKHTRKDYLKRQLQRDQQPLQQQPQQQQRELVELPTSLSSRHSRHPAVEQQQQPSDNEEKTAAAITKVTTYDDDDNHSIPVTPLLTQKENEGLVEESSDDKNKIIEKLYEKIEELQQEITYLHEQQQKQQEEKFTAFGNLELQKNDIPVKVIVNVKTKSIEWMEIARELIQKSFEDDLL
jgi:hypothetical protein